MVPALALVPLPVVVPLTVAAAMLAVAHFLPPRLPDIVAVLASLAVAAICIILAMSSARHGVLTYWFGGWTPRPGVVLGIGFGVDPASAAIAAFIAFLFAATFIFAWGYFDEVHAHFHVLMLLFLAAMDGFCLTRDLFNMFVWFEVMSVAGFALTAYRLETSSLAGGLNFTIVNSLASFMMLGGVGLIYARAGALDFGAVGQAVAHAGHDPVVTGAFCLLATALMIKGAIVPFHFWLSDAHAVAPSPVSVIFSGAMVSVALFVLAKLSVQVFAAAAEPGFLIRTLFIGLGCVTAVVGAVMTWMQRHLKRMLAFSTIAHLGIMLIGLSVLSASGIAGLFIYIVGHGLVKGTLFMLVGVLLATRVSLDELDLFGLGRGIWPAGIAMAVCGVLLGGMPWGVLDAGTKLIATAGHGAIGAWAEAAILLGTGLTGASVLRATSRVFLGLGPMPGPAEAKSPTEKEQEKANRPLWLMLAPCIALLAAALLPAELSRRLAASAAPDFAAALHADAVKSGADWLPWASICLAVAVAGGELFSQYLPRRLVRIRVAIEGSAFRVLGVLHSGLVSDYVLWTMLGLAALSVALAFG